jgi:hypothetical protein
MEEKVEEKVSGRKRCQVPFLPTEPGLCTVSIRRAGFFSLIRRLTIIVSSRRSTRCRTRLTPFRGGPIIHFRKS